jgi:uroporphyrinogen decarboxylase
MPAVEEIDPEKLYYVDPHDITGYEYPFYYGFTPAEGPGNSRFFPDFVFDTLKLALKKAGDSLHVSAEVFSPFTQFMEYFGYENALMALADKPDFCKEILDRFTLGASDLAVLYFEMGADAVLVSSAFAGGGFISRDYYREFVLPYEKAICTAVHNKPDCMIYVHTCGAIGDRIHLMVEAGYDGVDTMDPPPLGNTDITEVKQKFGKALFLKGNIDPVNIILHGTPGSVYQEAVRLIENVGRKGGYIISSACSIAPSAPPENIKAIARACRDNPV